MRIAVYSDIHSNQEALSMVLADMDSQRVDQRVCLGDVVGYGASPNECATRVQKDASVALAGNHDHAALGRIGTANFNAYAVAAIEWTAGVLGREQFAYLAGLPLTHEIDDALMVHATPREPARWLYVRTLREANEQFSYFTNKLCFVGHTHVPYVVVQDIGGGSRLEVGAEVKLDRSERCLVNVGSVGQPRDRDTRACYALYDSGRRRLEIRRVPYDVAGAQRRIAEAGLPSYLANRLSQGR